MISNSKYKNSINKVTVHTHAISIYGQTNLSKKLILQGFFSLASGNVYTILPVQNQKVKTKFANASHSAKLIIAYKSQVDKVLITPLVGFKYARYNVTGHDVNFKTQNLSISTINNQKASGLIGFEIVKSVKINNTTQIIPELHMEAEKFLYNKQQKLRMQIMSSLFSNKKEILILVKPAKYSYKIGGVISLKHRYTEIAAMYEYLISDNKYFSHKGVVKLKISF